MTELSDECARIVRKLRMVNLHTEADFIVTLGTQLAAAEREKSHQAQTVTAVRNRLGQPWLEDPEAALRDIALAVGYFLAPAREIDRQVH